MTERERNDLAAGLDRVQEKLWVLQAQQGDAEAFRLLVDRYERRLFYYLMRFNQNPESAADVLQEVWIMVFRGLKNLRAPEAFRVWLYQITHDKIVSTIRRESRKESAHEALLEEQAADEVQAEPVFDNAELVHQALAALSPEHREVLTLRFLEDLSLEEIAETLRCQLGTVKSRLHYARLAVRKFLEAQTHE